MVLKQLSRLASGCALTALLSAATAAGACGFHLVKAEKTPVDWLVDASHLVLARPDPEQPMRYDRGQVLRGGDGIGRLPFLVDSARRRQFDANSEDSMLFAANEDGNWVLVSYADENFRTIMAQVLDKAEDWKGSYGEDRFHTVETLMDHPDPAIRRLALSEIDKAPYAMLREIDHGLPAEQILDDLWTLEGYPYQPVRILLLGISGSEMAREEVHGYMERVRSWAWSDNLGAFSTALIELDGALGIDLLEDYFLSDPDQPLDKLDMVVAAVSEHHAYGDPALGGRLTAAIERFLAVRPEALGMAARQFAARSDWSLAPLLEPAMANRESLNAQDLVTIAVYLAQAKAEAALAAPLSEG